MASGFRIVPILSRAYALIERVRLDKGGALDRLGREGATLVQRDSMQSFTRQADPSTGVSWKPSLRAKKQHGQTLLDTGRMRRSVRGDYAIRGAAQLEIVGGTVPLAYAAIHQFGGHIVQGMHSAKQYRAVTGGRLISRRRAQKVGVYRSREVLHGMRTITIPARPFVGMSAVSRVAFQAAVKRVLEGRAA